MTLLHLELVGVDIDKVFNGYIQELVLLLGLNHARTLRTQVVNCFEYVNVALESVGLYLVDDHVDEDDGTSSANTSTVRETERTNHRVEMRWFRGEGKFNSMKSYLQ